MLRTRIDLPQHRRGGLLGGLLVCLILVAVIAALGYQFIFDDQALVDPDDLITQTASRGSFDHIVLEQGEIESSSNTELICEVKSRGYSGVPILWVIDEGTRVSEGEKLVELDSSTIEQELKAAKISVMNAEANVTSAKALVEQAEIAKQEYLEGVFKTEEAAILSEIAVAEEELRKAEHLRDSNKRLVAKGLLNSLQLEAVEFTVTNANTKVDSARARLTVLQNLTKQKFLVQFESDIDAAKAKLAAYESELLEEQQELEDVEIQLEKCVISAPADGIVVHANRYSSRGGNAEFVVEPGASVRERQAIIRLPDPTQMQVKVKINESRITLITEGMPVKISVDAIPGLKLMGRVKKVNRYAEPGSFFSSSIKEYATFIEIIDPPENIRTGMTAEVQIFVEQLDDALQVPIQALYEHGDQMYCLIQRGPEEYETTQVTIGATNDTMASITDGLSDEDTVVLNLRSHLTLMNLPEIEREDNSSMREIAGAPSPSENQGEAADGGPGRAGPGGRQRVGPEGRGAGQGGRPGGGGGGRQGGGGPQGGGGGGRQGGGEGRQGGEGGGFGGGGAPNPAQIVARILERNDTNGDGKLSPDELNAINPQFRSRFSGADSDGDGTLTRAELTAGMAKAFSGGGGGGGRPGGGGGGGRPSGGGGQ